MSSGNKDFDIILSNGESYTIEFKETADKSVIDEACAFANASGGLYHEEHVQYDGIIRKDLPLYEKFNEKAYKSYMKAANISEVLDRSDILINMGCAGYVGDMLCYTNAGALFFRINDEDIHFRHVAIVCGLYKGTDKAYVIDTKEFNCDLVSNIEEAITYLKRHLNLSYKIESIKRENILELPEQALREAVINAVCHRLYYEKGARVMVDIYDDRVEITSPGGVCKEISAKSVLQETQLSPACYAA